jgi:hypothetical protein
VNGNLPETLAITGLLIYISNGLARLEMNELNRHSKSFNLVVLVREQSSKNQLFFNLINIIL